ncbi:hypothetical protein [Cupriavidus necator]|uniref:hypothetical protein n=1 Tax=Cupriavidus necator TaxID=106590 RepID=UPI000B1982E4|nr:hypothetical protein [Cupriavidus necator]
MRIEVALLVSCPIWRFDTPLGATTAAVRGSHSEVIRLTWYRKDPPFVDFFAARFGNPPYWDRPDATPAFSANS